MFIIYKHTNKINGMSYIGQTCQSIQERWKNGFGYRGSRKFYNAIKKYGWNNFSHIILVRDIETSYLADFLERFYIDYYKTNVEGYNLESGGNKNHKHNKETIKILSEYHKNNPNSGQFSKGHRLSKTSIKRMREGLKKYYAEHPEAKNKLSKLRKNKQPWNKGKKMNKEFCEKISKYNKSHPNKGIYKKGHKSTMTEETRLKIKETMKRKIASGEIVLNWKKST